MKDRDRKQGGFKCGKTLPRQRETMRFGGDMLGSCIIEATNNANHTGRLGEDKSRNRMSALEEANGETGLNRPIRPGLTCGMLGQKPDLETPT